MAALVLGLLTLRHGDKPAEGKGLTERFHLFARGIREVVADRRVLMTSSMEGIQNMSMGALEAFLPVYAVSVAGLNVFQAGLIWGVQIVVTLIAKPLMGKVSDRWGRRPLIVAGMLLCAVPFALIPHLTGFVALMLAGMVFGLGEAFVTSSSAALVADFCKARHYGAAMGVFGTIFDVGHASGPIRAASIRRSSISSPRTPSTARNCCGTTRRLQAQPGRRTRHAARGAVLDGARGRAGLKAWYNDGPQFVGYTDNAARGSNRGAELELTLSPREDLQLDAALGLLDTHIEDFAVDDPDTATFDPAVRGGREQAQAPHWQFHAAAEWAFRPGWFARAEYEGKGAAHFSDSDPQRSDAFRLLNLSAGWRGGRIAIEAWVRNALDEDYAVHGFYFGNDPRKFYVNEPWYQYGPPRVAGLSLSYRMGG